jgi:hypothetical protein
VHLEPVPGGLDVDGHRRGTRVTADVRQRLLEDAVERGLHVLGEHVGIALALEADLDAGAGREALQLGFDRGHQPVVVERARAELAGQVQELLHRLVHEQLQLGDLRHVHGGAVLGQRLEAQQDGGERLVHFVVEVAGKAAALLLLRAHGERAGAAALLLDPLQQPVERARQLVDLLDRVLVGQVVTGRLGGVNALDPPDQPLERGEPALEHPQVHAQRQDDRERQDQERPALVGDGQVQAGSQTRGEQGDRDEHDIGGHDLTDQGVVASRHRGSLHGSDRGFGRQMGSPPHIGTLRERRNSW